jgi:hypothetical protein
VESSPSSSSKLPPKKLFKSKATIQKEEVKEEEEEASAASFKDWLGMKLSPEKSINQGKTCYSGSYLLLLRYWSKL